MRNTNIVSLVLVALVSFLVIFVVLAPPVKAQAQAAKCDPLPNVEWWSQTHSKVSATVKNRYKGDWSKYIKRWQNYRIRMQNTLDANSVAVVKSRGIKMQGKVLQDHINQIDQRVDVLKCLSDVSATRARSKQRQSSEQVAEISEKSLELEVTAQCDKGVTIFQITNLGDKWPRLASINIYRTKNKGLVSKRRMKLGNSQQATFKISQKKVKRGTELGIWVEPAWVTRPFKYDAKITCL